MLEKAAEGEVKQNDSLNEAGKKEAVRKVPLKRTMMSKNNNTGNGKNMQATKKMEKVISNAIGVFCGVDYKEGQKFNAVVHQGN